MPHPWKCRNGHENVTEIPKKANVGPRHRYVLKCPVPSCEARSWVFVGSAPLPFPRAMPKRRALKTSETRD